MEGECCGGEKKKEEARRGATLQQNRIAGAAPSSPWLLTLQRPVAWNGTKGHREGNGIGNGEREDGAPPAARSCCMGSQDCFDSRHHLAHGWMNSWMGGCRWGTRVGTCNASRVPMPATWTHRLATILCFSSVLVREQPPRHTRCAFRYGCPAHPSDECGLLSFVILYF